MIKGYIVGIMSSDENIELECQFMKALGILKKEEVLIINDRRKSISKKITLGSANKEELLKQINIESDLLESCQQKLKQEFEENISIDIKHNVFKIISNRINDMYKNLFLLFTVDNNNLKDYIEFCLNNDLLIKCSKLLNTLMSRHHSDPELYMTAARFEFEERKNIEQARLYYEQGLHDHSQCKEICLDEFWMEVQHCLEAGVKHSTCIEKYRSAIKHFDGDISFHIKMLDVSLRLRSVEEIQSLIVKDMVEKYKHHELLWHKLAQMQLDGFCYHPQTERLQYSNEYMAVHNCINVYEDVLNQNLLQIDKQHLWELYLDTVIEIRKSYRMQNESTKRYMHETLERAFQNAHLSGALHIPKYYLYWAENSSLDDRRAILSGAVKALKSSVELWIELLNLYVTHDCFDNLVEAFQEGVRSLKDNSLPLWLIMIRYMQNTHPKLIEQLFQEGSNLGYTSVALELRPAYLDWCVLHKGLLAARDLFNELKKLEPPCQNLYMAMINYEKTQTNDVSNINTIRKIYNEACNKFGKTDTEIWMECIRFEYTFGSRSLVEEIYKASLVCLEPDYINIMKLEFSVIKSEFLDDSPSEDIIVIDDD